MPTGPWTFYNSAKKHLMDGGFDLDNDTFMISLFTGATNATDKTLTTIDQVTSEVAGANGYTSGGKQLTSVTWGVGAEPSEMRFNCAAAIWNASSGNIANIQIAVIWRADANSAKRYLLAFCKLEDGQFTVTNGNSFMIDPGPNGIFELN
jgi:hypothetical protein